MCSCGCSRDELQGLPWLDLLQLAFDAEQERIERAEEERMRSEARAQLAAQTREVDEAERQNRADEAEAKSVSRDLYSARLAYRSGSQKEPADLKRARIEADLAKAQARTQRQQIADARAQLAQAAREIGGDAASVELVEINGEPVFLVSMGED